ncbi:Protein translocase subunit SecA [Rickettsiales endosymbiont of Paramecium tredecaurelia]|uniref:preprotein translocase subunit SecA n=1 Tax=Candidatus Sarmatiella mevalonica TaxID=2770581 RepID=UPI0019212A11|nr:preprotein translocase subunit SecA [Candidatus Sarmatiella mevalonica]MBL3284972.1 Protein translocase subunit SecA [Candidatus Sarmatiella mevalonica]
MLSFLSKLLGTSNDKLLKQLRVHLQAINHLQDAYSSYSNQELASKTNEFREKLSQGAGLDDILHHAFATVREASRRATGLFHFDEQILGGLALHNGMIAQMNTGEGKTLVAPLNAYLESLTGHGVHVVTVNDYLVARDAAWIGQIYRSLHVSLGAVISGMNDQEKKHAYACDVTYVTNNELGFDYLRDNMKYHELSKVLRPFHCAIIDEIDSILIDESRTPLIISGPVNQNLDLYLVMDKIMRELSSDGYELDEKNNQVIFTDHGITFLENALRRFDLITPTGNLYEYDNLYLVHHANQALKAKCLFKKDVHYLIKDNKLLIIDEFSGRVMDGRRYSDGLHQALEAKERLPIQNENQTLASITFQNYFRMYPKLCGMTGTAQTDQVEFRDIYNLGVAVIPPHNPKQRIDHDDAIYSTVADKYSAILKLVTACHAKQQPVLIGTISIEKSEEIAALLQKEGLKFNILNAKFHQQEAYIIAQAGRAGAITIATNMAGRGTDIILGGNPEMLLQTMNIAPEESQIVLERLREQSRREKEVVLAAGGLFVIGTERHDNRRVDNQLRGRSGRQGDPGETKFFLSLEDDLMRIFASERTASILRAIGLRDGEAIGHPMISKTLAKAQLKVEAMHYEVRKNLIRFDDVINHQRSIVYEQRNRIISAASLIDDLYSLTHDQVEAVVLRFIPSGSLREHWDLRGLVHEVAMSFNVIINQKDLEKGDVTEVEIVSSVYNLILNLYQQKRELYTEQHFHEALRYIFLTSLDQTWKDHLYSLDNLRQGISLRAYAQKDPLNEYKKDSFELFSNMLDRLHFTLVQGACHFHIDQNTIATKVIDLKENTLDGVFYTREEPNNNKYNKGFNLVTKAKKNLYIAPELRSPEDPATWGKIGRNEPCPCESGKKYKYCHGKDQC